MKNFTRVCLIVAGGCAAIGIALCIIGIVFFGADWRNITKYTPFIDFNSKKVYTYEESISDGTYTFLDFENLDIEMGVGTLEIAEGDVKQAEVTIKQSQGTSVYVDEDSTLCVQTEDGVSLNGDEKIKIVIPKGMAIGKLDLDVGAGSATIGELTCNQYDIDCGVGEVKLELYGKRTDYNFNLDCGVGQVQLGNETISGLGSEKYEENKNANGKVKIECGAGEVTVSFAKEV